MLKYTRDDRRQTFDRIRSAVLLHDVSDRVRPFLDCVGAIRATLAHAFPQSVRALGVDNKLLSVRLLDAVGEGTHGSPRHRDYPASSAPSRKTLRDARFCSSACRQAACRQRQHEATATA